MAVSQTVMISNRISLQKTLRFILISPEKIFTFTKGY